MKRAQRGMVKHGVRTAHIPKPHLKPAPFKKVVAIDPPTQTVIMYGEDAYAKTKLRFFSEDVLATKIDKL
jgi:hypothetical protein